MVRGILFFLSFMIAGFCISLNAQEPLSSNPSLPSMNKQTEAATDTIKPLVSEKAVVLTDSIVFQQPEFKPNPTKAVIYSAIFPGLGQLYNRKYWKLPIVYGGALGLVYAITWNGDRYNEYSLAYKDLILGTGTSYQDLFAPGKTIDDYGGKEQFTATLKRRKDFFRRNRDLAIIAAVGVYALCIIDAYVDAELYDFDMSPDLSMKVFPVIWGPTSHSKAAIGLQCSITF